MVGNVVLKEGVFKIDELKKGEIQKWGDWYYLACPRCGMALRLEHTVTINDKKEVTISPSIGHPKTVNGFENGCGLHIFVRDGKIEYLSDMK